jgi:hypothetical protein
MNQKNLISLWKTIPILSAFTFSVLLFVCSFSVKGTISALPLVAGYIGEGKSMFMPFIPRINLLFFLPEEAQVLPFTFGHLLDFIILVSLSMVINPIALPFWKKVCHEHQNNLYYDLHIGNAHPRQRPTCVLLDVNRAILLNRHDALDHPKLAGLKHACIRTGMNSGRSYDEETEHGYPAGNLARLRARFLESMHRQDREPPIIITSSLYRSRERLPGRDLFAARFYIARAVIASFFVSRPILLVRNQ